MVNRLFSSDKNYILKEVQASSKEKLVSWLVSYVKDFYLKYHNPLGLIDDTILEISKDKEFPAEVFDSFYHDMAAIYRFKHGEVQLEFLFDGSNHYEKYEQDWKRYFMQCIKSYCFNRFFVRAVLDISVFHHNDRVAFLAGDRLKYFLAHYFGIKVYKHRGIMNVAS